MWRLLASLRTRQRQQREFSYVGASGRKYGDDHPQVALSCLSSFIAALHEQRLEVFQRDSLFEKI